MGEEYTNWMHTGPIDRGELIGAGPVAAGASHRSVLGVAGASKRRLSDGHRAFMIKTRGRATPALRVRRFPPSRHPLPVLDGSNELDCSDENN